MEQHYVLDIHSKSILDFFLVIITVLISLYKQESNCKGISQALANISALLADICAV